MHNTCVSSSFSVRYKGSHPFPFNDYSCCFNDRFDRYPLLNSASLSSQCCACCCLNSLYPTAPILKPSCFYGLRQSTLIQWPPYKRLILNGLDRCYANRFSVSDVDRRCYCDKYDLKERKLCGRRGKLGRRRYRCMVLEEESERHSICDGGGGDSAVEAEVVLSLLTGDISDECFGVRDRRGKLFTKIDVEKGRNDGGNNFRREKKNDESGGLGSISKFEYQERIIRLRDKDRRNQEVTRRGNDKETVLRNNKKGKVKKEEKCNWLGENSDEIVKVKERETLLRENQRGRLREEEQESLSRQDDHRRKVRKDGSPCSSYYSFSSGEFEGDDDIEVQKEGFKGELSSEYRKDSKTRQEVVSDEAMGDFEKHGHSTEYEVVLSKENDQAGFSGVSSVVESDWRKKSEKKLTDTSVDKTQYGKDSAKNLSMYREDKGKTGKMSTLSVNVDDRTREHNRQMSETGTRMKYRQFTETSDTYPTDLETSSTFHRVYGSREENSSARSVREAKEHHVTADQIQREKGYRGGSLKYADASKVQKVGSRGTSTAERRSGIRIKDLEDHSTRIQSSIHDMEEQHHQTVQASRIVDSRIKHQQLTTDDNKETSIPQRESENRMRKKEAKSSSLYDSHLETKGHLQKINSKHESIMESGKGSQEVINTSLTSTSNVTVSFVDDRDRRKLEVVMAPSPSQSAATGSLQTEPKRGLRIEEIVDDRLRSGSTASSGLRTAEIVDEKLHNKSTALHDRPLGKSQMLCETEGDESHGQPVKHIYPEDALGSADRLQQSSTHYVGEFEEIVDDRLRSGSTAMSGLRTAEIVDEKLHNKSTALHDRPLGKSQMLCETEGDESHGQPVKHIYPEDALGSADRLQQSSAHYVGEFAQKVKSEISSSEIHKVKDSYNAKLLSQEKQHSEAGLSSHGSEVSELKEQDSRRSSQGSGIKGPSDKIWDVTEPTIQKSPEAEAVVAEAENAVVKRSGKSLWNIIADIVRFRWASHSENRSSPSKSVGKSSPNQSTSSETWFSGHEQDESNYFNVQNNRISLTQGTVSIEQQQEENISSNQVDVPCSSNSKGETKHNKAGASTSSVILQKDSSRQATSLPSNESSSETNYKATSAVTQGTQLSPQLPSLQVERILASGGTEGSGSDTIVQVDQPVLTVLHNKSSPKSRNEELKRRKLQRIDQLQKDRFDEWEEAYRLETEQQKMDEMFMKEALLEAKKAADSWEVPVGAVLVQDGKIIARGYNLVEELRDSTAHAEMTCIREASNILRTWRLSETALYVTLEPCPMCAGAILQARIDTVVWGAPNKLLGADGSWIRLFPNGDGGSGLESADKPAAPIHPFHPKIVVRRGVLSAECADMMQQFFQLRRKKEKKSQEPSTPPSRLPISHHPSKFLTKMHDAFHLMFCL